MVAIIAVGAGAYLTIGAGALALRAWIEPEMFLPRTIERYSGRSSYDVLGYYHDSTLGPRRWMTVLLWPVVMAGVAAVHLTRAIIARKIAVLAARKEAARELAQAQAEVEKMLGAK